MEIRLEPNLDKNVKETEVFFIGDVRDVIFSRAKNTVRLPHLFNGFGACGMKNPATTGEGIIFRGCVAGTPPAQHAGVSINYRIQPEETYTPFFVGWNGSHSFVVNFISETGITLNELYRNIFLKLGELKPAQNFEYIFLEIIGFLSPKDIFDRALQKRVDKANVLTTLTENAGQFFKTRIIYDDLSRRNISTEKLFLLCITGAGYLSKDSVSKPLPVGETVFYVPPQKMEKPSTNDADTNRENVLTHNHTIGWRGENPVTESLLSSIHAGIQSAHGSETVENSVNKLLKYKPDYLVHLDDWSVLKAAAVKVFLAASDYFNIESTVSR
jgi:hypothetical protein